MIYRKLYKMNLFQLKISIGWFALCFIVLPLAGFIFRSAQLQSKQRRIKELEAEMLSSHSEILLLQQQLTISKKSESNTVVKENAHVVENVSKTKLKVSTM